MDFHNNHSLNKIVPLMIYPNKSFAFLHEYLQIASFQFRIKAMAIRLSNFLPKTQQPFYLGYSDDEFNNGEA
jgi:hypothetical protein